MGPELNVTGKVEFKDALPTRQELADCLGFMPEKFLIVVDKSLRQKALRAWLKQFSSVFWVRGGEGLKDFERFPRHLTAINRLLGSVAPKSLAVVAVGGGTVGDFAGFFASIFKRGIPYVQIPTTFLAALDSAHGGKTGLNLAGVKNQIGSFHQPRAVWVAAELLKSLSKEQCHSALGELLKMALLEGGELFKGLSELTEWDFAGLWRLAPLCVAAKYQIVRRDPFETTGERQVLNLGHTLGHALEAYFEIPHGEAVSLGLDFAIQWSVHRGYFPASQTAPLERLLHGRLQIPRREKFLSRRKTFSAKQLERLLGADKKMTSARHVRFIFLYAIGDARPVTVPLESLVTEAERQGWIRR